MKHHLAIMDFALGALRRRLARSLALGAGIALVTALYGSGVLLTDALRAEVLSTVADAPALTVQRLIAGRPALIDTHAIDTIAAEPGVRAIEARVWGFLYLPALEANVVVVTDEGLSSEPATDERMAQADAILGQALAARLALQEGDRLSVSGVGGAMALHVQTIRPAESALHDADALYVSDAAARSLLGVPEDYAVDIAVSLAREEEAAVVGQRLTELVPGARVVERKAIGRAYTLTFDGRGGLMNALLLPCLGALLLLAWERLTGLGGEERREIAVLKATGWQTKDVLLARLYESLWVALGGAVVGVLSAYAYVFLLKAPGLAGVLFGWSVLHAELDLAPASDPGSLLALVAIVVLPFLALGLVPAWRAASIDPDRSRR